MTLHRDPNGDIDPDSVSTPDGTFEGTPWVDVSAYGAVGDGETDDSAALQAAVDAEGPGGTIFVPPGQYVIENTVSGLNQTHITGPPAGGHSFKFVQPLVTFKATESVLGDGNPMFKCTPDGDQNQDVGFHNLRFVGDTDVDPNSLDTAQQSGVWAIDGGSVKGGFHVERCTFRNVRKGIGVGSGSTGYQGHAIIRNSNFLFSTEGVDYPTTSPLRVDGCYFNNLYDWLTGTYLSVSGSTFQNDSYATNSTNISGESVHAEGNWFEGGNAHLDVLGVDYGKITASGNYFGAAQASEGYLKSVLRPSATTSVMATGNYFGLNNRIADTRNINLGDTTWFLLGNEIDTSSWLYDNPANNGAVYFRLDADVSEVRNLPEYGFDPVDLTAESGSAGVTKCHDGSGTPPFGLAVWDSENSEWVSQVDGTRF